MRPCCQPVSAAGGLHKNRFLIAGTLDYGRRNVHPPDPPVRDFAPGAGRGGVRRGQGTNPLAGPAPCRTRLSGRRDRAAGGHAGSRRDRSGNGARDGNDDRRGKPRARCLCRRRRARRRTGQGCPRHSGRQRTACQCRCRAGGDGLCPQRNHGADGRLRRPADDHRGRRHRWQTRCDRRLAGAERAVTATGCDGGRRRRANRCPRAGIARRRPTGRGRHDLRRAVRSSASPRRSARASTATNRP